MNCYLASHEPPSICQWICFSPGVPFHGDRHHDDLAEAPVSVNNTTNHRCTLENLSNNVAQ